MGAEPLEPLDPPLRVDWLAAAMRDGVSGRLGLTFLPGKRGASLRYPGRVYRRDLDADLATLRAEGVGRVVLLVTDDELVRWGDPSIVERGAAAGVEIIRFPMPDGTAPRDVTEMDAILDAVERGRSVADVAVACMGGVGRTGTVAACALVRAGWTPDDAVEEVRRCRHPTAVETPSQLAFVRSYQRGSADPRPNEAPDPA